MVACSSQHKSQFFTAGPTVKRIDIIYYYYYYYYYVLNVGIK